jgi:hypothetical protein
MIRFVLVASLLVGCRVSLETDDVARSCTIDTASQPCMEAEQQNVSDLKWIEDKVFTTSCTFSGCHNGQDTPQGKIDLTSTKSCAHLVDYTSIIEPTRKLVVPNDVEASYLMLMIRDVAPEMASPPGSPPPESVGYMPQGFKPLCCQKVDAVRRWIQKGAPCN